MIDLHTHIIPGLDDGPDTDGEAIEMCRLLVADGVDTAVATPHMFGTHAVTREDILAGVDRLCRLLEQTAIPLRVLPGAETQVLPDLAARVSAGEVLTLGDAGTHLLLELGCDVLPPHLQELLFDLQLAGVTPVIAHPERNRAIQQCPERLQPLVNAGVLTQLTAASFTGHFGSAAQQCALELLNRGLAHLVASDAHSVAERPPALSRARGPIGRALGRDAVREWFQERPLCILRGEFIAATVPDTNRKPFWRRWLSPPRIKHAAGQ